MKNLIASKRFEFCVEIIVYTLGSYLLLQRIFGISLSAGVETVFREEFVHTILGVSKFFAGGIGLIALVFKGWFMYRDKVGSRQFENLSPSRLSEILIALKHNTDKVISRLRASKCCCQSNLESSFEVVPYCGIIANALIEYTIAGFRSDKLKRKDLFISLYLSDDPESPKKLNYLYHADSSRFSVHSKQIVIDDPAFGDYECVRAIKKNQDIALRFDCSEFRHPNSRRHETLIHYIGIPIRSADGVMGFLNMEFHNQKVFDSEAAMVRFAEEHFLPFQLLLEQLFNSLTLYEVIEHKCGCNI